ncbi:hypothetical protein RRG08_015545 [Elysia crispata]|uniref:Uncharacterized protein n=1 Tax=Elysia crispata TaxID=231223 RepID=A0AAE1CZF8_9GAST|nr:hypothetical protein RRG08_015545 [Elysia crispata]
MLLDSWFLVNALPVCRLSVSLSVVCYQGTCRVSSSWSCPDDLAGSARACFSSYALRLQSIKQSPQKLCCGLDVEVFRSFCRSYVDGSRCEQRLRGQCPIEKQRMIDNALVSLDGARDALNHLCLDDNIVETVSSVWTTTFWRVSKVVVLVTVSSLSGRQYCGE